MSTFSSTIAEVRSLYLSRAWDIPQQPSWRKTEEERESRRSRLRVDSETDVGEGSSMISLSPARRFSIKRLRGFLGSYPRKKVQWDGTLWDLISLVLGFNHADLYDPTWYKVVGQSPVFIRSCIGLGAPLRPFFCYGV